MFAQSIGFVRRKSLMHVTVTCICSLYHNDNILIIFVISGETRISEKNTHSNSREMCTTTLALIFLRNSTFQYTENWIKDIKYSCPTNLHLSLRSLYLQSSCFSGPRLHSPPPFIKGGWKVFSLILTICLNASIRALDRAKFCHRGQKPNFGAFDT